MALLCATVDATIKIQQGERGYIHPNPVCCCYLVRRQDKQNARCMDAVVITES